VGSVDDLEDVELLEQHIGASVLLLSFLSRGYFLSAPCLREMHAAVECSLPVITVHEADLSHGGAPLADLKAECPEELNELIFGDEAAPSMPIPWVRNKPYQHAFLVLMAEAMLRALAEQTRPRVEKPITDGAMCSSSRSTALAETSSSCKGTPRTRTARGVARVSNGLAELSNGLKKVSRRGSRGRRSGLQPSSTPHGSASSSDASPSLVSSGTAALLHAFAPKDPCCRSAADEAVAPDSPSCGPGGGPEQWERGGKERGTGESDCEYMMRSEVVHLPHFFRQPGGPLLYASPNRGGC
jgi:hypothetical protein